MLISRKVFDKESSINQNVNVSLCLHDRLVNETTHTHRESVSSS